jgi:hypothetical protein
MFHRLGHPGGVDGAGEMLAGRRRRAEARLAEIAGDVTLCVIGRSGESHPGVKYHEGAAAALMEVQRRSIGEPIAAAVATVRDLWVAAGETARDRLGPDWVAYRQGGVDELSALVEEMGSSVPEEE